MSGPSARFKDETGNVVKERFKDFIISFTPGGAQNEEDGTTMSGTAMSQFKVSHCLSFFYIYILNVILTFFTLTLTSSLP